jgi:hypothetical protein
MKHRASRLLATVSLAVLALAACKPGANLGSSAESGEVAQLRAEVERLRKENADLRLSPYHLALEVDGAIRSGNEEKAAAAFKELSDTFPVASETIEMRRRLDTFLAQRRVQEEEEKRIAALGFKGLPVNPSFAHQDTALAVTSVALVKRWFFDSWGDGWRFQDAEKDRRMLVTRVTVSSKLKEPSLFGMAAYVADGNTLKRVGTLRYRFARWASYGAFLGTTADYRNEFSHSWKVPFTAGVSLSDEDLKHRPIYLVATQEGCHERHWERFGQPPIYYLPGECKTLKPSLSLDDFKGRELAVVKRID